jgi:hypothetical protein
MDNFRFDMICEGRETLTKAMELAFTKNRQGAVAYVIRPATPALTGQQYDHQNKPATPLRLVFLWSETKDAVKLPFKLDPAGAADFAFRWLAEAEYGREPDHDGSNGKGWRLYNEGWGHVDGQWEAIIAVTPVWACYGK